MYTKYMLTRDVPPVQNMVIKYLTSESVLIFLITEQQNRSMS